MKKNGFFSNLFMVLVFLFLYAPIFVLIVFSFNALKSRTVWGGFSLQWYIQLFQNTRILDALKTTLLISVIAAVVATIAGTAAAIGFHNMKRRPRGILMTVSNVTMTNAEIITGVSMMLLFVFAGRVLGFNQGFGTLLIAHITFDIPYVILSVMPKLRQLDPNIYEAAQDLGATGLLAFRKVVLPEIMPGVLNGMLIAFTMSIDDFIISYFTAGSETTTLALEIYSMTRKRISPEINALSTLMFLTVLILLVVVNVRQTRQESAEKRKAAKLIPVETAALIDETEEGL
ncbi:ABC transporter, permease protein [uncultured Eubacteriales bacterium]|uniref:ABC transporter, permease protein n=1 Tax=uncultured Eubacteriales bacterium TaxID=172733 RepID=A0A212K135_9FIRM|nr:ABC transporter, permease protein [uncultured Eubacteriales bacterium]